MKEPKANESEFQMMITATRSALKPVQLHYAAPPPERPRTRLQHIGFQQPHTSPPPSSDSDSEMTDDETDSEELDDMFGVTAATMTRRKRLFQKFNNKDRITNNSTTATIIMQWISRRNWAPTTKLSHFATLTKTLSLNKISIQGDIQGCIRQLKIAALASDIQRVPPLTTTMLNTTLQKFNNTQMEFAFS